MKRRKRTIRAALAGAFVALVAVVAGALAPAGAKDAYLGYLSAPGGVTVSGSPYRYVAISPRTAHRQTVVERIDLAGGRVDRWWYLKGGWGIPAGSYDADGAGLSADEGTLLLTAEDNGDFGRWPPVTKLAALDTQVRLRTQQHPDGVGMRHAIRRIELPGRFEVLALSPDGSTAYLTQMLHPHRIGEVPADRAEARAEDAFQVRALDLVSGQLSPSPGLSREGRIGLSGAPIDRVSSRDGRWSYGLYVEGEGELFVLAIDTASGETPRVARVDLPKLRFNHRPFGFKLRVSDDGRALVVFGSALNHRGHPAPLATVSLPIAASAEPDPVRHGPLGFLFRPVHPGNLMGREGSAGRSGEGREIRVRQWGDPARPAVLSFGCIHGDECAATKLHPLFVASNGCPDPAANLVMVPNLDPDGHAAGTRLNGDGVDLNRNFAASWRPIGRPGDPQYSGPRPFSEPESRLAARLIRTVDPQVTVWFHQYRGPAHGGYVRGWGQSAPIGRRFAHLAGIPFHLLPWPDGTAPNWQNHAFPGTSSFVVELPQDSAEDPPLRRLGAALARLAHEVGEDGYVARKG